MPPVSETQRKELQRCTAKQPRRPKQGFHGGQCGLWKGHDGPHTLLRPTGVPWFAEVRR